MHSPPAFFIRPDGGTAKIPREWAEASDWFVILTLATLFFLLGAFALWAWLIWRRGARPEPHVRLLMELEEEARLGQTAKKSDVSDKPAEWEKNADWWRKAAD